MINATCDNHLVLISRQRNHCPNLRWRTHKNKFSKHSVIMKNGTSDEVAASSDVLRQTVIVYGIYNSANSAFLRLSSMACRFPL